MTKNIRSVLMECLEDTENGTTMKKDMAMGIINKAISGDIRAFEVIAKFIGEFPSKREMVDTDAEIEKRAIRFL